MGVKGLKVGTAVDLGRGLIGSSVISSSIVTSVSGLFVGSIKGCGRNFIGGAVGGLLVVSNSKNSSVEVLNSST